MININARQQDKAFLVGINWMIDCCTFGTGISDSFPSRDEMNLENLNKIRKDNIEIWKLENIESQELSEYKECLKENELEINDDNLLEFLNGVLHWINGQLLNEYMDWKDED